MFKRIFLAILISGAAAAVGQTTTQPATQPSTQPVLKLRADAADSGEVDLKWLDKANSYSRYYIFRSEDHGKSFHGVGHAEGGASTGPVYQFADQKVLESTDYEYELQSTDGSVISAVAEVQTPHKNLLEAAKGQTKLQLTDVASVGFWQATLDAAVHWLLGFIPSLLVAVVIFFIFWCIYRFTRRLFLGSMKRAGLDPSIHDLLMAALKYGILGFGLVIALDQVGVHVTALLTGISIMGLAIGFAAQDTLSNVIASVVIFWDKPFKVGDWITLDGKYGRVQRITFRSTRILMENGDTIASPNTTVVGSQLINHSINPINWVSVPLGLPETTPIDRLRAALLATTVGDDRLLATPPPKVVLDSINPGQVNIFFCFCIKDEGQQSELLQDYLEKAKKALDQIRQV
jgi:small conductance mechanosensitive channel